jgi:hypothetical protein
MAIDGRPKFSMRENSSGPAGCRRIPRDAAVQQLADVGARAERLVARTGEEHARASEASTWSSKAPISRSIP